MSGRLTNSDGSHGQRGDARGDERGAALIFALLGLATLTILGLGLTSLGMMAVRMTSNERDTQQALGLADAGLAHARKLLTYQEWDWTDLTPFLNGGDGVGCTGDELGQAPAGAPAGYPTLLIQSAATGGQPIGTGTYRVYVCDDDLTDVNPATGLVDTNRSVDFNRRLLVRSVGTTANGATATVEHVYASTSVPALLVNGNLSVRGDVEVVGSGGIIHANGTMDIVGNSVCAQQYFSSTQQITGGIPDGGAGCNEPGELRPGSAPVNIRNIDVTNYRWKAEYWLDIAVTGSGGSSTVSGQVRRNSRWPLDALSDTDFVNVATPAGWSFSRNQYEWSSNGGMPMTVYYATTNVSLGGSLNVVSPNGMTVLARGWIKVAGGAKLRGKLSVPSIGTMTLVTNADLDMAGNTGGSATISYSGLFYARDQIEVSGNPNIQGQLVALNAGDTAYPASSPDSRVNPSNLVPLVGGYMKISGNPHVEYSGGGMSGTLPQAWRECRQDPANVNPLPGRADDACGRLYGGT